MRKLSFLILTILSTLLFFSCYKEVKLKYNHDLQRLHVDAILLQENETHKITISREIDIFAPDQYIPVDDLVIYLEDEGGNKGYFMSDGNGDYSLENFPILNKMKYTLNIQDGENFVSASCTTSSAITLDSIYQKEIYYQGQAYEGFVPVFTDPAGEDNYYFVTINSELFVPDTNYYYDYDYENDDYDNPVDSTLTFYVNYSNYGFPLNDQGMDGQVNDKAIPGYILGYDTLTVYLYSFDRITSEYLNFTEESGGDFLDIIDFTPSPANPTSNFKDDVLGFFTILTRSKKTFINP